jgi:Flp pilus assembly protein TadD
LARDIGARDQPTPVAAETVFAAGRSKEEGGPGLKWVLGGLTVVMLSAAGIWYYLTVTPVARNVPSPWVARGIESLPAVQPESGLPVTGGAEIPGAVPVTEAVLVAPATAVGAGMPAAETSVSAAAPVAAVPEAAIDVPVAALPAGGSTPVPVDLAPAAIAAAPAAPPITAAAPSLVRISRETRVSEQDRMVREAYGLYQAGDLARAQSIYLAVLNDSPDNIDALLGYGAIALRTGDTAKAVQAHGEVLRLDPDNDTALAVLVGLNKSVDLNAAESAINSLIKEDPDQPFLHFTLGNIYAAQQRWPESQQAFFDAHRIDSSNPDYALNLAISLDRIGQHQAALDYYNTALRLAEHHPASFDPSAILARIQSLSTTTTP